MKRQLPRPQDLRPLLRFKRPAVNLTGRRLNAVLTVGDLRRIAKRRTPKAAFDYADGAAEAEISLARARHALQFNPAILRDVSAVDPAGTCSANGPGCRSASRPPASPA